MEKRELYLDKIRAEIDQYSAKLAGMHGKANEVQADIKLDYLKQVKKLEGKRDNLKEKYEQLSKSSESSWKDMKDETEIAWNELKIAVSKATDHFR